MKLSMWMIANRLSSLDIELDIRENAPVILNSARRAYATNCVWVYAEKDYIVCNGEGDIIRFYNIDITQTFEIIQSVFDYFEDWSHQIHLASDEQDYQKVIELAWQVFHNPLVLFDDNSRVLGITKNYRPEELDAEWAYLCRYGYSSLRAVQCIRYQHSNIPFQRHGLQFYTLQGSPIFQYSGYFYGLKFNHIDCGHLNLLAYERPLNRGDHQVLEYIGKMLEPSLGQSLIQDDSSANNVFLNLLFGKLYDEKVLQTQLNYLKWRPEDSYQLALAEVFTQDTQVQQQNDLDLLVQTIRQWAVHCIVMKRDSYILILSNRNLEENRNILELFRGLTQKNPIKIGFSLPSQDLEHTDYLYRQAQAAITYGSLHQPKANIYAFFDYALDFMVDTTSLYDSVRSCLPGVVSLWNQRASGDELLQTLKCYLDHDRSASQTATLMHTHRNTILYRIQKLQDILGCSLEDSYIRDYCRISLRVLELYERQK